MITMTGKKGISKRTFRYQYAIIFGLTAILPLLLFLFVVERYGIVQEPKVALILGASLAIAMMGFMFSLRIVKQVTILAQDFIKVEKGELKELGERAISSEISEMARIADSFNRMAGQLGRQFKTLTAMVDIDRAILSALDTEKIINIV